MNGHHIKVRMGEWQTAMTQLWIDDHELWVTKFEIIEGMGKEHLVRLTVPARAITVETIERPKSAEV